MPSPLRAEEPEEVLIGTFRLQARPASQPAAHPEPTAAAPRLSEIRPAESDRTAPLDHATSPAAATPGTTAPAGPSALTTTSAAPPAAKASPGDQLGTALSQFATGDRAGGQRALEVLVADWPRSPEAAHARKALSDLYRIAAVIPEPQAPAAPAAAVAAPPARPAASAAAAPLTAAPTPPAANAAHPPVVASLDSGWTTEVRHDAGLDRRFILEAGDRVFFGEASADLGARARSVLTAQAHWLGDRPSVFAVIEGHADEPGSDADNVAISQQRAEAVRDRLIEEGVGADRLRVIGYGRSQRLALCDEPECAAQNRRVVTSIFTRDGSGPALFGPAVGRTPLSALPPASRDRDALATAIAALAPVLRPRR